MTAKVLGIDVDAEHRCHHYHSEKDVIAIKFKCCDKVYGCYHCHDEMEDHKIQRWKKEEFGMEALFCGHCKRWMTVNEYLYGSTKCFHCSHPLNPGCRKHWKTYFDVSHR